MKHEIKISLFLGVLSLMPLHTVLGGEPMKDLPGNARNHHRLNRALRPRGKASE